MDFHFICSVPLLISDVMLLQFIVSFTSSVIFCFSMSFLLSFHSVGGACHVSNLSFYFC